MFKTIKKKSSNVNTIEYFNRVLVVTFHKSTAVYLYVNVPKYVFQILKNSDSLGKAYRMFIMGKYEVKKYNFSTSTA